MSIRNERIVQLFEQLRLLRIQQGQTHRAKAYEKVIPILRNYYKDIESGTEARQIQGIGDRMAAKIDEIIRSGGLNELTSSVVSSDRENVLKLFESVERVGEKTALKWYNAGYRSLSDIPREICNEGQWIGLQLHNELTQRIPRAEIQTFEELLQQHLAPFTIQFQICGSYRRGKPDSGDIDILVIARPDINVIAEILRIPVFTHTLAYGPKKFLGICKINQLHRRIDIEVTQAYEYPFALVYFTGPARFNVLMRQRAIDLGVRLNEKSLTKEVVDTSQQILQISAHSNKYVATHPKQILYYQAQTEQDVFSLLGIQYLTPEERERFA